MICAISVFINATLLHIIVGTEQELEVERVSHPKPYGGFPGISVAINRASESTRERETYISGLRTDRGSIVSSTDRRMQREEGGISEESKISG